MSEKRYWYLKIQDDYFQKKEIKKLRKIAGGDTYTIIYLKMQLLSLKNSGRIEYHGIEDSPEEELALELDEAVEDIKMTIAYLQSCELIESNENGHYLPEALDNTASKTDTANRVARFRERKKLLHCNGDVTESNDDVTPMKHDVTIAIATDIATAISTDTVIDKNTSYSMSTNFVDDVIRKWNSLGLSQIKKLDSSTDRYKMLKARAKLYGENAVLEAIENIRTSNFLQGGGNQGFVIAFDWFVRPNNFIKVYEGKYNDGENKNSTKATKPKRVTY